MPLNKKTRNQSKPSLWFKIKPCRLTASNIGEIFKRQSKIDAVYQIGNEEIFLKQRKLTAYLMKRLKSTRKFQSAAMRAELLKEPLAEREHSKVNNDMVNLAPVGIVVSKFCP